MRVRDKSTPRGGVHPARQRAIANMNARPALLSRRSRLAGAGANSVAAVVAGILGAAGLAVTGNAHAQAAGPTLAPPPTSAQTSQNLQTVVVTATATAVKKLDASYNIVSVDRDLIKQSNPVSSADILKVAPGIWPESSGGQTGANIEVAGFPSGGDAPFFTNMIEGMPLYGMPNLSFMDSSSFFRLDDTVDRVEIVQLGTAALFGPGQMGATANYLLRTGDSPGGSVGVTYGTDHKWRVDVFNGFKIADGWYGSFGGFYRIENGVRNPQFPENNGGQFTATLKHDLDGGSVKFWARVVDDKNQFIVPVPLVQNSNGNFSSIPGFDALTGTYGSYAIQNVSVPNPMGGFQEANLANGRGTQFFYFGSNYDQTFGNLALHNGFIADGGGMDTNALFSGSNPRPLSMYLYGCNVPEPTGWCNGTTPVDTNNLANFTVNGVTYSPNGTAKTTATNTLPIIATYAGTGQPVPLSQSVIQQGWWFIQKSLQNFADEFRATMEIFPHDHLTGGVYLAVYSDNDKWSLGNQMLMTNTNNATGIVLNYAGANGTIYNLSSPQGFVNDNGNFNIVEHGVARNVAGYLSDAWHDGPWLIDIGARLENLDAHQRTCNYSNQALGPANDLWDNAVPICNGTWDFEHYERTRPTFTGGVNYEISSNMSAYIRINNGVHFDDFDNGIRQATCTTTCGHATAQGFSPLETVQNQEVGFKWQTDLAYIDLDLYHRTFNGLTAGETTALGAPTGVNVVYGSKAVGVNFDGYITPFKGFVIRAVGDYMDGSYENAQTCYAFTNLLGQQQCVSYNGAPLQRQPKFQIRVTPSYTMPMPWGDATAELQFEHVGQRYEDQTGLQPLGAYNEVDADLIADYGDHWQLWITGTNLSNTIALTEGNARKPGQEVGVGNVILARPIEGREVDFTVYYKW